MFFLSSNLNTKTLDIVDVGVTPRDHPNLNGSIRISKQQFTQIMKTTIMNSSINGRIPGDNQANNSSFVEGHVLGNRRSSRNQLKNASIVIGSSQRRNEAVFAAGDLAAKFTERRKQQQ